MIHLIREEHGAVSSTQSNTAPNFSLANFVLLGQPSRHRNVPKNVELKGLQENISSDPDNFAKAMKPVIIEAIQDVQYELETVYENVAKNAKDHVHSE